MLPEVGHDVVGNDLDDVVGDVTNGFAANFACVEEFGQIGFLSGVAELVDVALAASLSEPFKCHPEERGVHGITDAAKDLGDVGVEPGFLGLFGLQGLEWNGDEGEGSLKVELNLFLGIVGRISNGDQWCVLVGTVGIGGLAGLHVGQGFK